MRHDSQRAEAYNKQDADAGSPQAKGTDWEALAKQFYVMHGAKRSGG